MSPQLSFWEEHILRAVAVGYASVLILKELQMAKKIDSISPTGGMLTCQIPLKSPESKSSPLRQVLWGVASTLICSCYFASPGVQIPTLLLLLCSSYPALNQCFLSSHPVPILAICMTQSRLYGTY